jgi:preprotein translocase subunit SecG
MIYTLLVIIIAIICVLLTIMVLLQSGEGGGLSGIAAGGSATQMMGQRRATDFLSKATGYLGGSFLVLCVVANFFIGRGVQKSAIQQEGAANAVENNAGIPSQSKSAVPLNQQGGKPAAPPQKNSKNGNGNGGGNKPSGN